MTTSRTVPASGNPLIDHQHGRLTELIRLAAQSARNDMDQFGAAVLAFRTALAEHFKVEGVIFRGAGFTESAGHDGAHASILERLDAIARRLSDLDAAAARHAVVDEMERILFDHELLEDSAYWEVIRHRAAEPAVAWEPSLETGLPWLDDQHRHLIAIINELIVAATKPHRETAIAELMERFLRHARQHFAAEERQLAAWGNAVSTHRAEHARLIEEVESLAMTIGSDPKALVNHYLRFWMLDHIRVTDRQDFADRG
ncbi:MAG: hemerythrin domain-containing protein [Phaeospirillum sp.]|nr:hemerythrin domain-containing protein [Phaeospirillum sp.]